MGALWFTFRFPCLTETLRRWEAGKFSVKDMYRYRGQSSGPVYRGQRPQASSDSDRPGPLARSSPLPISLFDLSPQ
jgi:hypothetical protein